MNIHLDFETRCLLDLRKVGLVRYTQDPSFRVLLTGVAVWDGDVACVEGLAAPLPDMAEDSTVIFHAFNAPFEQAVLRAYGIEIPAERWRCTMARAYSMGFFGGLAQVGAQVGIPIEQQKRTEGSRLIRKFCTPRSRPSKANPEPFWEPQDAPEDWARFRDYCRQDVVAERAIERLLDTWDPQA